MLIVQRQKPLHGPICHLDADLGRDSYHILSGVLPGVGTPVEWRPSRVKGLWGIRIPLESPYEVAAPLAPVGVCLLEHSKQRRQDCKSVIWR